MGFQGGGGHHILPEVSYVLEKTSEAVDGGQCSFIGCCYHNLLSVYRNQ